MIQQGDVRDLEIKENAFDYVLAINLISELEKENIEKVLNKISLIAKKGSYVTFLTWNSEKEKNITEAWNITSRSIITKPEWVNLIEQSNYSGNYSFKAISYE